MFRSPGSRLRSTLGGLTVSVALVTVSFVARAATPASSPATALRQADAFVGENASFAIQGNVVTMFSGPNGRLDAVEIRCEGDKCMRSQAKLRPEDAKLPLICDQLDQIDVGSLHPKIRAVLPKGSKLKDVLMQVDGTTIAIYTIFPNPNRTDVRVALLKDNPSKRLPSAELVQTYIANYSDAAFYCGATFGDKDHVFVLVNEPAGSSDSIGLAIYYLVRK
jgi:hypothetical protein